MNRVELTGRLTRDPEIHYAGQNNDFCIATYTLAVDREYAKEGDDDTDFIRCKALGKRGEFAEKHLCKGMKIGIWGRIQTGSYDDKETGKTVYTTDVLVDGHEFEESKATNDQIRQNNGSTAQESAGTAGEDGFMSIPDGIDDELPFA